MPSACSGAVCLVTFVGVFLHIITEGLGNPLKENRSICLLPPDEGPCRALIPQFYYDRYTQSCKLFHYGGCYGNDNRFEDLDECEKSCWHIKKVPKICRLEADEGVCKAMIKKYFYNLTSEQCEPFYYGGCYGNDNNFIDEDSCMQYCEFQKYGPMLCFEPKDEGECSAEVTRFYYNYEKKTCAAFQYTGCGGNNNNFVTLKDCNNICTKVIRRQKMYRIKKWKPLSLNNK